jgi:hypothetical protein
MKDSKENMEKFFSYMKELSTEELLELFKDLPTNPRPTRTAVFLEAAMNGLEEDETLEGLYERRLKEWKED